MPPTPLWFYETNVSEKCKSYYEFITGYKYGTGGHLNAGGETFCDGETPTVCVYPYDILLKAISKSKKLPSQQLLDALVDCVRQHENVHRQEMLDGKLCDKPFGGWYQPEHPPGWSHGDAYDGELDCLEGLQFYVWPGKSDLEVFAEWVKSTCRSAQLAVKGYTHTMCGS